MSDVNQNNLGRTGNAQAAAVTPGATPVNGAAKPNVARPVKAPPAKPTAAASVPLGIDDMLRADKTGPMVMSARREVRRGNRDKARQLLQQVFALEPTDCGALELLGDIFMEEGEQEKALKVFERGQQYHPRHKSFEEKIAVCHLDLAEMEHDRLMREQVLETGATDKLLDRKPGLACSLSIFLPGAGQFYNDDMVRGGILLGTAILTFCGWYFPLAAAIKPVSSKNQSGMDAISAGLNALNGFPKVLFWAMLICWVGTYIFAAVDAFIGAERANAERRRAYGL